MLGHGSFSDTLLLENHLVLWNRNKGMCSTAPEVGFALQIPVFQQDSAHQRQSNQAQSPTSRSPPSTRLVSVLVSVRPTDILCVAITADCKSAGLRLRWFESSSAHHFCWSRKLLQFWSITQQASGNINPHRQTPAHAEKRRFASKK
jgi:hypothetical protein